MKIRIVILMLLLASAMFAQAPADALNKISSDFWSWRAKYKPFTFDDVPRMEHVPGKRDWSATTIESQREDLARFEQRLSQLAPETWPVPQQVDYWLVKSALARARWELDVFPRWKLDPMFYIEQTVVPMQEALMVPPPFSSEQSEEVVVRAENMPALLQQAKANLHPASSFAQVAISALSDIESRLTRVDRGVSPLLANVDQRLRFHRALAADSKALADYREWLKSALPSMPKEFIVGEKAYGFYLHNVALLPYTPAELTQMARQDFNRVLTEEALEKQRNIGVPALQPAATTEEEIAREAAGEANIRAYLTKHELLTVPADMPHWTFKAAPDYVLAFDGFAEQDDFTGASRPTANGVRWIRQPKDQTSFFERANATDPRLVTVHEGIPGHYFQLSMARRNADPIRRQYYDSTANEGIGFYAERMMLDAGLFDDSPRSRETILRMARLRALRVEVDVKLATQQFTIEQAADYLSSAVPMDHQAALTDALDYTMAPALGVAYETGKLQVERLLTDARLKQGDKFNLREFDDYIWKNGNVPLALLRWELLGLDDDIKKVKQLQSELPR